MKYKNTRTGAVIDSPCKIAGSNWVELREEIDTDIEDIETSDETGDDAEDETIDEIKGFNGISIKEIKQELDAFGIEYNPKAKKQELYELMIKGR